MLPTRFARASARDDCASNNGLPNHTRRAPVVAAAST